MSKPLSALVLAASLSQLCACAAPEVRIGKDQGIPSISGSETVNLGSYTCGQPISNGEYTVTTTVKGSDCEFSFDKVVTVVTEADYQKIGELKLSSNLVQGVELEVKTLKFKDTSNGMSLDLNTYVKSASLKVDGQEVATKETLASLPKTVRLEGQALSNLKAKIDARQAATVRATAVMLVPMSPAPPASIDVEYDAQPTLVLGTGSINLGG